MHLRSLLRALACGVCFLLPAAHAQEIPSFAKDVPLVNSLEPVLKFNGKDLTGFYVYTHDHKREDPLKVFTVQNGMIRVSGEEYGAITTSLDYKNYHLIVEWKWGDQTFAPRKGKSRDSGILLHCVGPDGAAGGQWMQSIECQVIEGGCGDFIMVKGAELPTLTCETRVGPDGKQLYYEKGGKPVVGRGRVNWWGRDPEWKDVTGFRGKNDVEKPAGEWNRMEVICDGDTITNIVNGYVVNAGTRSSQVEGKIQFQSEGAAIFFRRIEVRPLAK
jgi:hypothetical protein